MLKKITVGAISVILVGLWGLWFIGGKSLAEKQTKAKLDGAQKDNALLGFTRRDQPDTDGDGLKDWEEELWNTDPKNPDTDGDDKSDGEEILNNSNPAIGGPDDILADQDYKALALVRQASLEKQAPLIDAPAGTLPIFRYQLTDLTVLEAEDKETLTAYGRGLAKILANHFAADTENEMVLVLRVLKNQSRVDINKITKTKNLYLQTAGDLLKVAIPPSAGRVHLALLNALVGVAELDFSMEKILSEPILALESAQQYSYHYAVLINNLYELNRYFLNNNIRFEPQDNFKIVTKL